MNVHERLTEAVRMVKERDRYLHSRETTSKQITEQKKLLDQLQRQLTAESRDVERMDGITFLNLWHTLRGTKEEAKRKEQEEYLAAKLKYDEANAVMKALEADLVRIDNHLTSMGDVDIEYQQVMQEKEEYLLCSGGSEAECLINMSEELGSLKAQERELLEALEAGRKAEKALTRVLQSLGKARGWGTFDLVGGGLISTAIKHSHINDARNGIDQAQIQLRKFQRELADVKYMSDSMEIGGLATFADFFLDGLLFDAIVQMKINSAQDRTKQLQRKVENTIHELDIMKGQSSQKLFKLEQRRREIIENVT